MSLLRILAVVALAVALFGGLVYDLQHPPCIECAWVTRQ
jgi:hypothetical protein